MRASARKGVHVCVCECMRPGPLFLSCLTRAAPPFVLTTSCSLSCPQHALLLPSSTTPAASSGYPLVLEMHRCSPGHQHESLVPSSKTRLSCRAPARRRSFSVVLRAVQRLAPMTRATLATSGDGPAQPGPVDTALAPLSSPPPQTASRCHGSTASLPPPAGGWLPEAGYILASTLSLCRRASAESALLAAPRMATGGPGLGFSKPDLLKRA